MVDTPAYPQWNPVFVEVDGPYVVGKTVLNRVREPSGAILEMTATVETLLPGAELYQSGGVPGILTFNHRWLLEPADDGTKVIQHEVDRGIGLWFWNSDWIEPDSAAPPAPAPKPSHSMERATQRWKQCEGPSRTGVKTPPENPGEARPSCMP